MRALLVGSLVAMVLVGCTVGPDYQRPTPPMPAELPAPATTPAATQEISIEDLEWWQAFGDARLASLVERAMSGNLDLEISTARVLEARAARRAAGGQLAPSFDAALTGGRSRASARGPGPLAELAEAGLASLENEQYTAGVAMSWELDLFGRVRRLREASQARLEGSLEAWRATSLLVASEVARSYVELCAASRRSELAERNLTLQQTSFEVIEGKVDVGLAPSLDLERSNGLLASVRASLAPLRAAERVARDRLSLLLGELPGSMDAELQCTSVPVPPNLIAAGTPLDLINRRPDLRQAERELHAATAEVGVAIGNRLPRVSLGGSLGLDSASLSDLLRSAAHTWSIGPRVDVPLFRGGQLAAGVDAARARLDAADATYRRATLAAFAEVSSTAEGLDRAREALQALQEAAAASTRATEYAQVLYDEGLRDHLVLLDAQRAQTSADDAMAVAEADLALRALELYRALGGGWQSLEEMAVPGSSKIESP